MIKRALAILAAITLLSSCTTIGDISTCQKADLKALQDSASKPGALDGYSLPDHIEDILSAMANTDKYALVYFYNSKCDHCDALTKSLQEFLNKYGQFEVDVYSVDNVKPKGLTGNIHFKEYTKDVYHQYFTTHYDKYLDKYVPAFSGETYPTLFLQKKPFDQNNPVLLAVTWQPASVTASKMLTQSMFKGYIQATRYYTSQHDDLQKYCVDSQCYVG